MKEILKPLIPALALFAGAQTQLLAQGTAFTYQGRLNFSGGPAAGSYDFRFRVASDVNGNNFVGSSILTNGLAVTNGLFTTTLDFGAGTFNGHDYWLQIEVKTNGAASYSTLTPLQQFTPTPYAIFASSASNVSGTVSATQLSGTLPGSVLPGSASFSGVVTAGSFAGNGAGVTNVNAAALNGLSSSNFWQTGGNAGTSPLNGNFLGTVNNQPLEIRVGNSRALRLEPTTNGLPNVVAGSTVNYVVAGIYGSTISGGGTTNNNSGGGTNSIAAHFGTISGGRGNRIGTGSIESAIGGGGGNQILTNSSSATIGGGYANQISTNSIYATVSGGEMNVANGPGATIGGGEGNYAGGIGATIGGGGTDGYWNAGNTALGNGSVVAGGVGNQIQTNTWESTISGGLFNNIGINANSSVIGGGYGNSASGTGNTIGGGAYNVASGANSTIAGGFLNSATKDNSFAVGYGNVASGIGASALGVGNAASGASSVALGTNCTASGVNSLAAGERNISSGRASVALGGIATASGDMSVALGGASAGGQYSTATGYSYAGGDFSMSGGYLAQANHAGSFVWADFSSFNYFVSTTDNEFSIRAQNGVRIQTDKGVHLSAADRPIITRDFDVFAANAPSYKQGIGRWGLFMEPSRLTIGIPGNDLSYRYFQIAKYNTNGSATQLVLVDQSGNLTAAGTVTGTSDRNAKEHFDAVNPREVLARVAAMPVSEWNYKEDPRTRHIGPMAQDFYAAFNVGPDDKHITMVDADGVAIAAIQGLNQKLEEKNSELQSLKARLEKLERLLEGQSQNRQ